MISYWYLTVISEHFVYVTDQLIINFRTLNQLLIVFIHYLMHLHA